MRSRHSRNITAASFHLEVVSRVLSQSGRPCTSRQRPQNTTPHIGSIAFWIEKSKTSRAVRSSVAISRRHDGHASGPLVDLPLSYLLFSRLVVPHGLVFPALRTRIAYPFSRQLLRICCMEKDLFQLSPFAWTHRVCFAVS